MVDGLFAVLVMSQAPAGALDASTIFKRVAPSTVVVHVSENGKERALGSGVTIGSNRVATNAHVVGESTEVFVSQGDRTWSVSSIWRDAGRDVAILTADGLDLPTPVIGSVQDVEVGMRVFVVGAPRGFEASLSDGLVSALRGSGGDRVVQITAPISPGSSGGGVFDDRARLIGLTTLVVKDSQNLNFALPVDWVAPRTDEAALAIPDGWEDAGPNQPGFDPEAFLAEQRESPDASADWRRGAASVQNEVSLTRFDGGVPDVSPGDAFVVALREARVHVDSIVRSLADLRKQSPRLVALLKRTKFTVKPDGGYQGLAMPAAIREARSRFPAAYLINLHAPFMVDGVQAVSVPRIMLEVEADAVRLKQRIDQALEQTRKAAACLRDLETNAAKAWERCSGVLNLCPLYVGSDSKGLFYFRTTQNYDLVRERIGSAEDLPKPGNGPWRVASGRKGDDYWDERGTSPAAAALMREADAVDFSFCRARALVVEEVEPRQVFVDWEHVTSAAMDLPALRATCGVPKEIEPNRRKLLELIRRFPEDGSLAVTLANTDGLAEMAVRFRCRGVFRIREKWALAYRDERCEVKRATAADIRREISRSGELLTEVEREEHLLLADRIAVCAEVHAAGYRWEFEEPDARDCRLRR